LRISQRQPDAQGCADSPCAVVFGKNQLFRRHDRFIVVIVLFPAANQSAMQFSGQLNKNRPDVRRRPEMRREFAIDLDRAPVL
jgi:hypothetical protein